MVRRYGRGEDGLMFGSVHTNMALEMVYWLQKTHFAGHVYFDTFPRNEDPVGEAEYNIRKFKELWYKAEALRDSGWATLCKTYPPHSIPCNVDNHPTFLET